MVIHVEEIKDLIEKYRAMMKLDPNEVELYENGRKIEVPQKYKDDWRFTGLGFCGFIETEFYKSGFTEDDNL